MITIISSKRHQELLAKERAADAIDDQLRFRAAWQESPDLDVVALRKLQEDISRAYDICENGSRVRSILLDAKIHFDRLVKALP
jgi:hypothetical protein